MLREVWGWRPRCVLLASTGGGGDPGSALYLARLMAAEGARVVMAVLPWERFVRDPAPGPIPLEAFSGVERLSYTARVIPRLCHALRRGRLLEPSACSVAREAPGPVYLLDGWGGVASVERGLMEAGGLHGCDAAAAFDVGGDMLATGGEEGLWSPLADSLGLAAVASLYRDEGVAVVHSPGSDGELSPGEVLERIAAIAARGGYRWARAVSRFEAGMLEEALRLVHTEAGVPALLAARGRLGPYRLRGGTRRLDVSILQAFTFFLDARASAEASVARLVAGSASLDEARERMNAEGIYTELDLEEDISLYAARAGRLPGPGEVAAIREEGRRRLRRG